MQKLILVAWLAAGAAGEEVVWIEAEQFQSHGGWTNDAQFIDQMGSPYLLTIGRGTPVEDAITTARLPHAGTYRLWVRAKDWAPEHHPGLFQVSVGQRTLERVFGGSGRRGWIWEDGGVHELSGDVELRLHDRPGGLDSCMGLPYSIPCRSLYSKNVENLLMAGRDISVSHMALSDTRVMLTCAVIGQAAGTAAALCVQHNTTPRGVYQEHLEQLQQQLLKDGAWLIDLANRDPRDLARSAAVTASSELVRADGEPLAAANAINGLARASGGKTNAWSPQPGPPTHWLQLEWPQTQTFNMVHVSFAVKTLAPQAFRVEVWQDDAWRTVADVASCRQRRCVLGFDSTTTARLRCDFTGMTSVAEIRVYDEPPRLVEIARRVQAAAALPEASGGLPWFFNVDPRKLPGLVMDASQVW